MKPGFLPQTRREWWTAAAILSGAVVMAAVLSLAYAHLNKTALTLLTLAVLAMEPWLHERHTQRRGQGSSHALHRGRMGVVTAACAPDGRISLDGTTWAARSLDHRPLEPGECVYVHGGQGLLVHVSRDKPKG